MGIEEDLVGLGIKIITECSVVGTPVKYFRMGLVKGRNLLLKLGFAQCVNPMYYQKGGEYVHYNNLNKIWIIE